MKGQGVGSVPLTVTVSVRFLCGGSNDVPGILRVCEVTNFVVVAHMFTFNLYLG